MTTPAAAAGPDGSAVTHAPDASGIPLPPLVPAPSAPVDSPAPTSPYRGAWLTANPVEYSASRAAAARARLRGTVVMDVVTFTASCPGCGQDVEWHEERQDTRLSIAVNCPCPPA